MMNGMGSGRTYRQLSALPDGGVFIVAHDGMIRHCQDALVAQGRRSNAVTILPLVDAWRALSGMDPARAVSCDHDVLLPARIADLLRVRHGSVGWPLDIPEPGPDDPPVNLDLPEEFKRRLMSPPATPGGEIMGAKDGS